MNEENPWKTLSGAVVYDNPWISVSQYDIINPAGNPGVYGKVHFKGVATGVVVLDGQLNIYLVGQYRYPINRYSWEIPEGGSPLNIDPLIGAKRELLEETGLVADHWEKLLHMH
ncbi:MAG: NUDIX hydrolase, partial [Flavitalea sp.]